MSAKKLQPLLSKAWSGSSMLAGVKAMTNEIDVKTELPQETGALSDLIQENAYKTYRYFMPL